MDLTECKQCKSQISTNSTVCPCCGASLGGSSRNLIPKLLILAVIVFTAIVIMFVI